MKVSEVRRCLLAVRQAWGSHSPETPLNLTRLLPNGEEMHSFCYAFILAHHNKRMQRSRTEGVQGDDVEEDEEPRAID